MSSSHELCFLCTSARKPHLDAYSFARLAPQRTGAPGLPLRSSSSRASTPTAPSAAVHESSTPAARAPDPAAIASRTARHPPQPHAPSQLHTTSLHIPTSIATRRLQPHAKSA
ncbi:hypothetical protein Taro_029812 [Colocasia esculenta]|uniref:Uncharacterized protein n=1 Tax=Colocasia esculenta TaxID=4460 RepID=A0A843VS90_COLES|nr:hypothetical protein [Colocasia esculenta]